MANLGNAWHLPGNPEPRGHAGMRDPVFPTSPVPEVTIITGNQFTGIGGNPGNQLQDGSALFFRRAADAGWQMVPLMFASAAGNNKYYSAAIPAGGFAAGTVVQYYLRIAYDDHATTFLQVGVDGISSVVTGDETAAQAAPFSFAIDTPRMPLPCGPGCATRPPGPASSSGSRQHAPTASRPAGEARTKHSATLTESGMSIRFPTG